MDFFASDRHPYLKLTGLFFSILILVICIGFFSIVLFFPDMLEPINPTHTTAATTQNTTPDSAATTHTSPNTTSSHRPSTQEASSQTTSGPASKTSSSDSTSGTTIPVTPTPEDTVRSILERMTLEEKVAQMFFVRCPETDAAAFVKTYQPGGYLLFARDFEKETKESISKTIESYQNAAKIPLLIGVDEEGGTVTRVSRYPAFRSKRFASPRDLFTDGGLKKIETDTIEKCSLLASLGINVNLAPVCDLSNNPNDFIYERTLSDNPQTVSDYVSLVVSTMNGQGMGCTLKHFPGYGNNVDTHTGIAIDNRSLTTFQENDFLPFLAGIDAGADSILVSHNIVTCMDEVYPASLSPAVHTILRETLGFTGVIMTDDLIMDAITEYTDGRAAAVLAVLAGNDLLICSDLETQYPAVLEAVQNGTILETRIDESVLRILLWKWKLNLIS